MTEGDGEEEGEGEGGEEEGGEGEKGGGSSIELLRSTLGEEKAPKKVFVFIYINNNNHK